MTNAPALPASAADYIAHIDLAFELMIVLDGTGRIVRANAAATDILGYAPVELAGRQVRELLHPDEHPVLAALGADVKAGRPCREREVRWRRKDGQLVYLSLSARWSERSGLAYASARDVTAHRAAREELARSRERMNAMLESIGDAFFAIDRDWRIIYANRKAGAFIGAEVAPNIGRHLLDIAPALEGTENVEYYRRALETGEPCFYEVYWAPADAWLEARIYPTADGLSVYFHDVTAKRVAADAVRKSEQRFRSLFQQAGDSIVIADRDLRIVAANGRACARFGYTESEFGGLHVSAIDGNHAYTADMLERLRAGETQLLRIAKRRKDGSTFPAEVHISRFEDGGHEYFQAIIRDLTEREEAERQLRASEQRFREVIEMTPAGYVLAAADGRVLDVNPALCSLAGHAREALLGQTLDDLFVAFPWHTLAREADGAVRGVEAILRHAQGWYVHVVFNGSVRRDADGNVACVTGLMSDITDRKRAESRLHELATHDTLTGLPNRALLHERVQRMLDACPHGRTVAVMFLDLDRFKEVNDSFGHDLGDMLLCEVAARLRKVLRPNDVIARLGGDEFVVAAECAGAGDAGAIAAKLLDALGLPVRLGTQEVTAGASIGISLFPQDAGTKELLFQTADTAMYGAKRAGRNRYRFFEPEMTLAAQARMALEMALRPALARAEFELHYQPRVDLRTMTVVGLEALLRWTSADLGRVSPGEFIPVAEETGLIVALGRWVLGEACRRTRALIEHHGQRLRVSVNVSARQLAQPEFVDDVRAALADSGLPADCLELELTESALIEDIERTAAMLDELHALGVKLAVDDFGTGYSAIAYLRRFPIDVLKLDRSFVLQADGRISALDFIKAFVDMAHALKLSVVAEGVETADVLDFLRAADCDEVQGYLLARPMPEAALDAWLRQARAA